MEYTIIQVSLDKQVIKTDKDCYNLAANSVNYLKIKCEFDSEWDGLLKLAVFENVKHIVAIHIDDEDLNEDGTFFVPSEVVKAPGFKLSFIGTDTELSVRLDGTFYAPSVSRRITTIPKNVPISISGPVRGMPADLDSHELNIYEIAQQALTISKEAYALAWNTQEALQDLATLLGGNPYELYNLEQNLQSMLNHISHQQIQTDAYGNYIIDGNGNFQFEEVEDG